jgi:hypothetical protein
MISYCYLWVAFPTKCTGCPSEFLIFQKRKVISVKLILSTGSLLTTSYWNNIATYMLQKAKQVLIFGLIVTNSLLLPQLKAQAESKTYFRYGEDDVQESVYWSKFPIPRISSEFTPAQREILWEGLRKAQDRLQSKTVLDCINRRTTEGIYPDETAADAAQRFTINAQKMRIKEGGKRLRRQRLYIEAVSDDKAGGFANLGRSRNEVKDLKISLSTAPILVNGSDFMAGLLVHEILHTQSYSHAARDPNAKEGDYSQFDGNFVYETTWCVGYAISRNY